jgi:hypothetical protein
LSRVRARLLVLALATAALSLVPGSAGAATWCVYAPAGCAGTAAPALQDALDAAAALPGRDRIEVGEHAGAAGEAVDVAPGNEVDVEGVGASATIVIGGPAALTVREPSAVLRNLYVLGAGERATLVDVQAGTLDWVAVEPLDAVGVALHLGGGALHGTGVYAARTATTGILADGDAASIVNGVVEAPLALESSAQTLTLRRTELAGGAVAARVTGGALTADDSAFLRSVVATGAGGSDPALVDVAPGEKTGAPVVALRSSTVTGSVDGAGVRACAAGGVADVTLLDTLVVGNARDVVRSGDGCSVHLDHAGYATREGDGFDDVGGVLGAVSWPLSGGLEELPGPAWDSPARDHGSDRPADEGETDLAGRTRVVDGRRDIGALEYRHVAPQVAISGPDVLEPGGGVFAAGVRDGDGEAVHAIWSVDGAAVPNPFPGWLVLGDLGILTFRPVVGGPHTIELTVTDPTGLTATARKVVTATVGSGPADGGGGVGARAPQAVVTPPSGAGSGAPVVGAGVTAPGAGLRIATTTTRLSRAGRVRIDVRCTQATRCHGALRVALARGKAGTSPVGQAAFSIRAGGRQTFRLRVPAALRRTLRRARTGRLVVTALKGSGVKATPWTRATVKVTA